MKQIDKQVSAAFRAGRNLKSSNTTVIVSGGSVSVYLFGNLIARRENGCTRFQTHGWDTRTTAARLNACGLDCRIRGGRIETPDGSPVPRFF